MECSRKSARSDEQELIQTVLDSIPLPVFIVDSIGRVRWVNGAGETLSGQGRLSLIAQSLEAVLGNLWTHPSGRAPDGPSQIPDLKEAIEAASSEGMAVCKEVRIPLIADGDQTEYWLKIHVSATPIGAEQMVIVVIEDVTRLKELEKKGIELERLNVVVEAVGTAAHELNQPLSVLVGNLDLMKRNLATGGSVGKRLDRISESADRMTTVVRALQMVINSPKKRNLVKTGIHDLGKTAIAM